VTSTADRPVEQTASAGDLPGRGLRILFVTNMWPVGDSFRGIFVQEQAQALRDLGVDLDVEIVAQARGRRDYLFAMRRIRKRVKRGGYDLVHIHHGFCALACRFIGDTPKVLGLYGHDVNWHWQAAITRLTWGGVAEKVYVSRRMAVAAKDPDGRVIPNGVDFNLFSPDDRDKARAELGFSPEDKVVLFGGAPANWVKGYDIFTDVLAALRERGYPAKELVLPAPGQTRAGVRPKFNAADVLLFTSLKGFEGSPTVVKEATAIGLPVVTTDVGDVVDVLRGVTPSAAVPWPEPWGTPQARATLISNLADEVAKVFDAGTRSNGREVNAWLSWEQIGRTCIEMYREVLSQARPAARR
jgi:teichuronic acid biosynthesis glycosyltransferase TuaC